MHIQPPRRRWFQFSLGGFFTLLTIAALWAGAYVNSAHRQRDAATMLRKCGCLLSYDYPQYDTSSSQPKRSAWRDWIIAQLGEDYAANVQSVQLAIEAKRSSDPSSIADERLRLVSRFSRLEQLFSPGVDVTDAGLAQVERLRNLKMLVLSHTKIGDDGLRHLANLEDLEILDLNATQVGDPGLKYLAKLSKLRHLNLRRTRVTEQGAKELQKSLPTCRIGFELPAE